MAPTLFCNIRCIRWSCQTSCWYRSKLNAINSLVVLIESNYDYSVLMCTVWNDPICFFCSKYGSVPRICRRKTSNLGSMIDHLWRLIHETINVIQQKTDTWKNECVLSILFLSSLEPYKIFSFADFLVMIQANAPWKTQGLWRGQVRAPLHRGRRARGEGFQELFGAVWGPTVPQNDVFLPAEIDG